MKDIKILFDLEENIKELVLKIIVEFINFFNYKFTNSKDRKEHFSFVDKLLGVDKYAHYNCHSKANAISLATKTNQKMAGEIALQNTWSSSNLNTIPRQTIGKVLD